jgi:hypothetical protein
MASLGLPSALCSSSSKRLNKGDSILVSAKHCHLSSGANGINTGSANCFLAIHSKHRENNIKARNHARPTPAFTKEEDNEDHNSIILWSETSFFIAYINFVTLLVLVEFLHDTSLSFVEVEGALVTIRIFMECPCILPQTIPFPDNPIYYLDFD